MEGRGLYSAYIVSVASNQMVGGLSPSGRANQIADQAVIDYALTALRLSTTNAGLLPDFDTQTRFAASMSSSSSGAE